MSIIYGVSGDVRLALGNPTEVEVPATMLQLGRRRASRLVDGFLEKVYPTKIPILASGDVPSIVSWITNDIATYYIMRDMHPGPMPISQEKKQAYWDDSIALLDRLQSKDVMIPEFASSIVSEISSNRVDSNTIFDVDPIESSTINTDLLDDISDDRD